MMQQRITRWAVVPAYTIYLCLFFCRIDYLMSGVYYTSDIKAMWTRLFTVFPAIILLLCGILLVLDLHVGSRKRIILDAMLAGALLLAFPGVTSHGLAVLLVVFGLYTLFLETEQRKTA